MKRKNKGCQSVLYDGAEIGNIYQGDSGWYVFVSRVEMGYSLINSKKDAIRLVKDVHNGA